MTIPPAASNSFEDHLHRAGVTCGLLLWPTLPDHHPLNQPVGHRAIGVVYNPHAERVGRGNFVISRIAQRYDAFIFLETTRAVRPVSAE